MSPIAFQGRLPGVRVDPSLPSIVDESIRLDVAGFVGFAERGPLDDPQPVEDPAQYATVFGGDVTLAIDDHGMPVYAALATAVQSFFDNGGRRAYVVRVADAPVTGQVTPVVAARIPLGDGASIVAVEGWRGAPGDADAVGGPLTLMAATPGRWADRLSVEITIRDTLLAIESPPSGPRMTAASRLLIDEGDAVLLRRDGRWRLLWGPPAPSVVAPGDGWRDDDVVRLLRADLVVRLAATDGSVDVVERFEALRLGPGRGRSTAWTDVLQPPTGFRRERSMYVRVPLIGLGGSDLPVASLVPLIGATSTPVTPATTVATVVADEAGASARGADGLEHFDPVTLFLDQGLRGHTVDGLRTELELVALDDDHRLHGVHALAVVPDAAIVAVPDLTHRPWVEQAVVVDPVQEPAPPPPPPPAGGFHDCPTVVDAETPVVPATPGAARLRLVSEPPAHYDAGPLHEVSAEVAVLCAARGDLVAVLGLPRHAGLPEADDLAEMLRARHSSTSDVPSYVGVWHPWGAVQERVTPLTSPIRAVPPVGAAAGVIAATELARGWWVEPAGRRLDGFVGADVVDATTTLTLFDRGVNVVRRRPGGYVTTSAHTTSADRSLLQLSVRRLLIWVRLLALRQGARYVFEPDSELLRAQLRATFRHLLEGLRIAGALHTYDVVIEPLAGRPAAEDGRLRIDLKLAPTSPIEFITISLLRSGDGLLTAGTG